MARVSPAAGYAQEIDNIAHDAYCGRDFDWLASMTGEECRELLGEVAADLLDLEKPRDERGMNATLALESAIEEWAEREWEAQ